MLVVELAVCWWEFAPTLLQLARHSDPLACLGNGIRSCRAFGACSVPSHTISLVAFSAFCSFAARLAKCGALGARPLDRIKHVALLALKETETIGGKVKS